MFWLSALNLLFFLAVTAYALYLFIRAVHARARFIMLGRKAPVGDIPERIKAFFIHVFGQKKLLQDKKSGVMHVIFFYGFIVLQIGAVELIIRGLAPGFQWPLGSAYRYYALSQEIAVTLVLIAAGYAFYRRYIEKLARLKRGWKAGIVLVFLSSLMLSEILALGFARAMSGETADWAFAPLASFVVLIFSGAGQSAAAVLFYLFWWVHLLILLAFLVYVPQSKHAHLLFAPVNVFFKKAGPAGRLSKIDFADDSAEEFGAGSIESFTRQQLIDLYACVECGRCTSVCPASATGKTLSPMELITKLRDHLTNKGAGLTSLAPWVPAFVFQGTEANRMADAAKSGAGEAAAAQFAGTRLAGDVISEQELWACTTCRNCEEQCPVMNEHVDKIVDMRRYLVLTKGKIPAEAARAFQNIERQHNPWGIHRKDRLKWREGMEDMVPTVQETGEFELLFWVGSMGSYDARSQKIARSFARIMHKAGIKFAVLGEEETNSGDTARRMGNEYLFQQLCEHNIAVFRKYGVKKIVTTDPHAYNTFKNEYPEFGLEAEVLHHTEVLARLIAERSIRPAKAVGERVVYHDSCYLGRYNGIYDAPRSVLRALPGAEIAEMERNREQSLCCGAGGGLMWLEETEGTRMNIARTEMALSASPSVIASSCPYCLAMFSDGTKAKGAEARVRTVDIVELLEQSL